VADSTIAYLKCKKKVGPSSYHHPQDQREK